MYDISKKDLIKFIKGKNVKQVKVFVDCFQQDIKISKKGAIEAVKDTLPGYYFTYNIYSDVLRISNKLY